MKINQTKLDELNQQNTALQLTEDVTFASEMGTVLLRRDLSTTGFVKIHTGTNVIFQNLTFGTFLNCQESLKLKGNLIGSGEAKVQKMTIVNGHASLPLLDTNSFHCDSFEIPALKTKKSRQEKNRLDPSRYLHGSVLVFNEHARDNIEDFLKAYRNYSWRKLRIDAHLGDLSFDALKTNGDIEIGIGNVINIRTLTLRGNLYSESVIICSGDLFVTNDVTAKAAIYCRNFHSRNLKSSSSITAKHCIDISQLVKASYLEAPEIFTDRSEKLCVCGKCLSRKRKHCTTLATSGTTRCTCSWCVTNTKCLRSKNEN
jgi:hypothetical protein